MKRPAAVLLAISLVANAMLLLLPAGLRTDPGTDAGKSGGLDAPAGRADTAVDALAGTDNAEITTAAWQAIESTDLATLRDHLRAAGFPEDYVRALVWRRIQERHAAGKEAILAGRQPTPFWQARDRMAELASHYALRDLDRALREEFKTYFSEGMGDAARMRLARERLTFLPGDKVEAVTRITSDYSELINRTRLESSFTIRFEEDAEKIAMLEEARQADLATVLTPEELLLYELHTSQTANRLRSRMTLFEPTEEEFLAVYSLQRGYDDAYGSVYGSISPEESKKRAEARRVLDRQIESALGEQRSTEYRRASSFDYLAAVKITDHFGFPRDNAAAVYGMEAEFNRRRDEITKASAAPEARAASLKSLHVEASARLEELLGAEGAQAFRESGGAWLRNFEQQTQRTVAPRL